MRVSALNLWPRFGSNSESDASMPGGVRLKASDRKVLVELRNVWLRLSLDLIDTSNSEPYVIGVTSVSPNEGKSTNCLGLASTLAREIDEGVLVIESDMSNATLAEELDLHTRPGLAEFVTRDLSIEDVVQRSNLSNLDFIVAGGEEIPLGEDWGGWTDPVLSKLRRNLPALLEFFKQRYRFIIIDIPPVASNVYAVDMAQAVDGSFLSVRAGVTPIEGMKRAVQDIGDENLLGVVLVGATSPVPGWASSLLAN